MKYKKALIFCTCDPLHYGHLRLFRRAKKIANKVYACTESNDIIQKAKGRKAYTSAKQRVEDLEGIKYLDGVLIRTQKINRDKIVTLVKPDVLILGSDWKGKDWEGRKYGIKIVYLPRTKEISSTELRESLK